MHHLCYLCLVFFILSRLLTAALRLPEGKGLTSWPLFVMFIVILLLSHLVSFLIVSIPDHCCLSYFVNLLSIVSNIMLLNTTKNFKKYFLISAL